MANEFPFETNANRYLRKLWNKKTYLFLADFFANFCFDKSVDLQDGVPAIEYCRADGWRLPGIGSASSFSSYYSYFKLYDASTETECKVGVKDGSLVSPMIDDCGVVWANGLTVVVDNYVTGAQTVAGGIWFWIVAFVNESGLHAEIQATTSAVAPTPSALAYRTKLVGRATIAESGEAFVATLNQDYLQGGEWETHFWNECDLLGGDS